MRPLRLLLLGLLTASSLHAWNYPSHRTVNQLALAALPAAASLNCNAGSTAMQPGSGAGSRPSLAAVPYRVVVAEVDLAWVEVKDLPRRFAELAGCHHGRQFGGRLDGL